MRYLLFSENHWSKYQNLKNVIWNQMERLLMSSYKRCKYKIVLFDYGGTLTDVDEMGGSNQAKDIGADGHELKDNSWNPKGKQRDAKRFRPARSDIETYRDLLGIKKV